MPTSTDTTLDTTAGDLIASAAYELGAVGMGDELESAEETEAIKRFNGMLKTWGIRSNLFRETSATITITGGLGAATLPAGVRDVMTARHIVSATQKRPLAKWNRDQFFSLPNRDAIGNPTIFYYSQQVDADQISIWPVPAADVDLEIDYSRAPFIVTDVAETLDLPDDWYEAALFGLAARMAGMFGAVKLDPQNVARVEQQAQSLYQQLLDQDRPDSYYFEADSFYGYR